MKNKISINSDMMTLTVNKDTFELTRAEYLVLQKLMQNQDQILTSDKIAEMTGVDADYVRNVIQKLRGFGLDIPRVSGYVVRVEI